MKPYIGSSLSPLDGDGAVTLPDFLLAIATERAPDWRLFAAPDRGAPCLALLDPEGLAGYFRAIRRGGDACGRRDFALFEPAPFYASGRLLLPPLARSTGWIGDRALVIGVGDRIEIWDPERAATHGDGPVAALALLYRRMAAREAEEQPLPLPMPRPPAALPRPRRATGERRRAA